MPVDIPVGADDLGGVRDVHGAADVAAQRYVGRHSARWVAFVAQVDLLTELDHRAAVGGKVGAEPEEADGGGFEDVFALCGEVVNYATIDVEEGGA